MKNIHRKQHLQQEAVYSSILNVFTVLSHVCIFQIWI